MEELLGADLLRRMSRLDVVSRKIFAGKLPGERRSKKRGQSVEFDDYRDYVPGDDLRHIDWNAFARFDRFFIKLFREEEDLAVRVVLDCSGSMRAGDPSKLVFAARLAMAIGSIGLVNMNRVSAATFGWGGEPGVVELAPMRGRRNVERLGRFLLDALARASSEPAGAAGDAVAPEGGFFEAARRLSSSRSAGRGVLVVISDFLVREGLVEGLNYYAGGAGGGGAYDTTCLQVLSPDEIDPALARDRGLVGDLRLTDVESGRATEVTVSAALLRKYRERFEAHQELLERSCRARSMSHLLVPTGTNLESLIMGQLRRRGLFR
ncbi:MAG: DUF58 domain-containing protein [Phycisphaerales bacterium JB059]